VAFFSFAVVSDVFSFLAFGDTLTDWPIRYECGECGSFSGFTISILILVLSRFLEKGLFQIEGGQETKARQSSLIRSRI